MKHSASRWIVFIAVVFTLCSASKSENNTSTQLLPEQVDNPQDAAANLIPLTKCCNDDEVYKIGFDDCVQWDGMAQGDLPIIVYSTDNVSRHVSSSEFILTFNNLTSCQTGYVVKSWIEFQIYENGSLKTYDGNERQAGDFCVQRIPDDDSGVDGTNFAVRSCVPNPCENTTSCVRKCCPAGMAINQTSIVCESSSIPFVLPFRDENGVHVEPHPSMTIYDGAFVDCQHGAYALRPSADPNDEFYILPDGKIHVPSFRIIGEEDVDIGDDYCVDHFINENGAELHALVCFPEPEEESDDETWVRSFYPYIMFASSLFLIATFVIYALLPELRNTHGVIVMCHVASMAVMYIGMGIIQLFSDLNDITCIALAVLVHFTFLATFTWLNVLSFDIWWSFNERMTRQSNKLDRRFIYFSIYAWSIPTIIVGIGQLADHFRFFATHIIGPGFGRKTCWFNSRISFFAYLYGPMAVLLLANLFFFITTTISLCRTRLETTCKDSASLHHSKQKFRTIFVLFVLMGMSWITEVVSFAIGGLAYLWIPTDILNILTGVFVFFVFVCKPSVWSLLKRRYPTLRKFDGCCPSCMKSINNQIEQDEHSASDLEQTAI